MELKHISVPSGIRKYSSMSSQVPSGYGGSISDIAFESSYPYSIHPTAVDSSIDVGDIAEYTTKGILVYAGGDYRYNDYPGLLAFTSYFELTFSDTFLGSSGIREYSSMSSQVPTTSQAWISDIAFESNYPYSLHPTATNDSINVGDFYWYQNGVKLSVAGAAFDHQTGTYCGPFAFDVYEAINVTPLYLGSSGSILNNSINMEDIYWYNSGGVVLYVGGSYVDDSASGPLAFIDYYGFTISNEIIGFSGIREYSSMSSQVPTTDDSWVSDIAFESNYPYSLHPTAVNGDPYVEDVYWYGNGVNLCMAGGSYVERSYCGLFEFHVAENITNSHKSYGSSGIRSIRKVSKWTYNLFGWCWL